MKDTSSYVHGSSEIGSEEPVVGQKVNLCMYCIFNVVRACVHIVWVCVHVIHHACLLVCQWLFSKHIDYLPVQYTGEYCCKFKF